MHEVHRPGQVVMEWLHQRMKYSRGKALLVLASQIEFHFRVDAIDTLVIILEIKHTKTVIHHPETPTSMKMCQLGKLLPDRLILMFFGFVIKYRWLYVNQFAGLTNAAVVLTFYEMNQLALFGRP